MDAIIESPPDPIGELFALPNPIGELFDTHCATRVNLLLQRPFEQARALFSFVNGIDLTPKDLNAHVDIIEGLLRLNVRKTFFSFREGIIYIDDKHSQKLSLCAGNHLLQFQWAHTTTPCFNHIWQYGPKRAAPRKMKSGAYVQQFSRNHAAMRLKRAWKEINKSLIDDLEDIEEMPECPFDESGGWAEDEDEELEAEDEAMPIEDEAILGSQLGPELDQPDHRSDDEPELEPERAPEPIEDEAILDSQLEPIDLDDSLVPDEAPGERLEVPGAMTSALHGSTMDSASRQIAFTAAPKSSPAALQALALTPDGGHPVLMTPGEFVSKWGDASSWTDGQSEAQAVQAAQGGAQGAAAHSDSDGRDSECMLLEPSSLELLEPAWEECMSEIRSHRDWETDDGGDPECMLLPSGHQYLAEIHYFSKFRSQKTTTRQSLGAVRVLG